ncbi:MULTISPECIES: hypothetical protein [Mameliella]|uniref:hypothetical protein n=1 Tax=Mameliella TaxID=1434019 RepID=UPI000B532BB3|nr:MULTISPECIES: hypothetical protein [Mameliella]OWV46355.1 hypothetical protein CDZ96_19170 [Mameliella alba]OWV53711.1 hypothetical protein CDZ98_23050 [Mameliella alba]GGF75767.1 hypothetical protein GCM10011319_40210 [Mameliella alba]
MKTLFAAGLLASALATPAVAAPLCDDFGFAGLLAACNRAEEPIRLTLASGEPLGEDMVLQSGAYYELEIVADGSAELAIEGPSFFRSIWMNEIVINKIEIRPMAIDSIEFDKAGTVTLSFIAIKPGSHVVRIPGTTGETQRVTFNIQ